MKGSCTELQIGATRGKWVLVEYVPIFSPGLNFPGALCYNTCKCTAPVAAMPLVVELLLLREGMVGKVLKTKRTDKDRHTDSAKTASNTRYSVLGTRQNLVLGSALIVCGH